MAWFGGGLFVVTRYSPAMKGAGPAAGPVQLSMLRKGGLGPFFLPAGAVTLLTGFYLYYSFEAWNLTGAQGLMLNLGVLTGTVAFVLAAAVSGPTERKMKRIVHTMEGAPSPEERDELATLAEKSSKTAKIMVILVAIAVLGMAGRGIF